MVLTRLRMGRPVHHAACLLPEIIRMVNPAFRFNSAARRFLIIVVGVMDCVAQARSHISRNHIRRAHERSRAFEALAVRNESCVLRCKKICKELQKSWRRRSRHRLTSFARRTPATSSAKVERGYGTSELMYRVFSTILVRFFACAIVVRVGVK